MKTFPSKFSRYTPPWNGMVCFCCWSRMLGKKFKRIRQSKKKLILGPLFQKSNEACRFLKQMWQHLRTNHVIFLALYLNRIQCYWWCDGADIIIVISTWVPVVLDLMPLDILPMNCYEFVIHCDNVWMEVTNTDEVVRPLEWRPLGNTIWRHKHS